MRVIYINSKRYNGEFLPPELDNKVSLVVDMYEELKPEDKSAGLEFGEIKIVNE